MGHSWPLGLSLDALVPHCILMTARLLRVFCVYREKLLYPRWQFFCLTSLTSAEPRGINKWLGSRESGRYSFILACVMFQLMVSGNLGPSSPPGSLREFHLFYSQHRKDKSSCMIFHYENLKYLFKNNILYKGTRTREP